MDSNDLMSSIAGILDNPEASSKLQGMAKMLSSKGGESTGSGDPFGDEIFSYVSQLMSSFNKRDNRIDLLNSIRPYLRESRAGNIDMAIRIIRLMNLARDFNFKDVVNNVSDL